MSHVVAARVGRLRFIAIVLTGLAGCALGNPLALTHRAYISREELRVTLKGHLAEVSGSFVFLPAVSAQDIPGRIEVPVWIPTSGRGQESWHAELMKEATQKTYWKAEEIEGKKWAQFIALEFVLNQRLLRPEACLLHSKPAKTLPTAWARDGWMCLLFSFEYEAADMQKGGQVQIRYKQPHSITRRTREFFYIPNFDNFPETETTNELSRYQAVLINHTGSDLRFGGMVQPVGSESRWPLAHHRPLLVNFP